jgi:hypothetical protein
MPNTVLDVSHACCRLREDNFNTRTGQDIGDGLRNG